MPLKTCQIESMPKDLLQTKFREVEDMENALSSNFIDDKSKHLVSLQTPSRLVAYLEARICANRCSHE